MTTYEPPPLRISLRATAIALFIAIVVLLVAVLPAEYGIDPTGAGDWLGIKDLGTGASSGPRAGGEVGEAVESNATTLRSYRAFWTTADSIVFEQSGSTREGDRVVLYLEITQPGIVALSFTIRWEDTNTSLGQATGPDTFRIQAVHSSDLRLGPVLGRNEPGEPGAATASREIATFAQTLLVEAQDEASAIDAADRLQPRPGTALGSWQVVIDMVEAQDGDHVGASQDPDLGNDWDLIVSATVMEQDTSALQQVAVKRETVTLDLEPGDTVEYKFGFDAGAIMDYAWHASGNASIRFDLHGDRGSENTTQSHRSGLASADEGKLRVPFSGNHGWFFANPNEERVSITLSVRGEFESIGVVATAR